ncbi:uncharacterized protein BP01DRAFT_370155 [Aspergillus saccharolyticus JOP 1030-1]|uniref:Uncharacterized protein n=1 Tax=Aspergillus saccharolyticus JOP 1030-1 TaxID=1450539 RepID=A0A318ZXD9_9EURO|nr:hypothetical protein BP01DRAFT_370155 [Aspergillus saccharolyticus JOP 1030-1]PYH40132.1 hypothetical protein BP01DRAFT_370155 [Aspergillus saccharolyticus JOP 1030-1]
MFGWSGSLGCDAGLPVYAEPEKERCPPSAPTQLDFPVYHLPELAHNGAETPLARLNEVLASIRRPQDINPQKFEALNLRLESDVPAARIVRQSGLKTAPPLPWENTSARSSPVDEDGTPILMDNENPYPSRDRFELLQSEMLLDNDDAFREVARLPPREGRDRVRVTHTRKFWTGLERMAQYWDTSLDDYFERPASPPPTQDDELMQTDEETRVPENFPIPEIRMDVDDDMNLDDVSQEQAPADSQPAPRDEEPKIVTRYKGRRVGAGSEMPEDARDETIRALTEMAAWPFGCQVALPIAPPKLATKTVLFPVRQTFVAARSPKDRQLARSGVMEGPVFAAQCRPETSFRGPEDTPGESIGDVCDLLREVGAMLLTAQERARQGATEVRPGEGQWWTTVPRWGGAPNHADGLHGEDDASSSESGNARKRHQIEHPFLAMRRPSLVRKLSNNSKWKIVEPGPSLWDRRMRYIQIGKPIESPFDDIYMLSSINHHLAILHLRVHRRYLEMITHGCSDYPPVSDGDQPWQVLQLRRTKWGFGASSITFYGNSPCRSSISTDICSVRVFETQTTVATLRSGHTELKAGSTTSSMHIKQPAPHNALFMLDLQKDQQASDCGSSRSLPTPSTCSFPSPTVRLPSVVKNKLCRYPQED